MTGGGSLNTIWGFGFLQPPKTLGKTNPKAKSKFLKIITFWEDVIRKDEAILSHYIIKVLKASHVYFCYSNSLSCLSPAEL